MKKIKLLIAISMFSLLVFTYGNAQVVAVSCIESEHAEKMPSDITLYFENELLGFLFDEGLIVTSVPYRKENIESFNKSKLESIHFEDEVDFVIVIYFMYEKNKKYDEFKRKNLLPCNQISCKVIRVKDNIEVDSCHFAFNEMKEKGMFNKVDVCLLKMKEIILNSIRRKV